MNTVKKFLLKREDVFSTLIALLIAFGIIAILLMSTGRPAGEAFYYFIKGAFGNVENTSNTISRVIPLTIAGVAFLIGAKCAVFNVGVEGQLILGAMASAIVGYIVHLPAIIHLPLMLLAGMAAGGLYASSLPG
jgi:simple sugar transport system permease protein